MPSLASIIAAALRDPDVAAALRDALGPADPWVRLDALAAEIGAPLRAIRLAMKRGELRVAGPRCARVTRRSWADAWIVSCAPIPRPANDHDADHERDDARTAVAAAAVRARRGSR